MATKRRSKVYGLADVKEMMVPAVCRFEKMALTRLDPWRDAGYEVIVQANWHEGRVWVTARHGIGIPFSEYRGEAMSTSLSTLDPDQEEALALARLVQAYLDLFELPSPPPARATVKRLFWPEAYMGDNPRENYSFEQFEAKFLAIQRAATRVMVEAIEAHAAV